MYFKENDLYHIRVQTETPVFENTWCIYSQILENNNILFIIDEISLLCSKMLQILYYIKLNTNTEFILLGDYDQLEPIEEKNYDYRNSLILKEIVDRNIQVWTRYVRCSK